jgi:Protein of unknown function (DUF1436).
MDQPIWQKQTSAYFNNDLFIIKAFSGYRAGLMDPLAHDYCLAPDCSNAELGQALLSSLAESRALPIEEDRALAMDHSYYPEWIKSLMERYGYKTKRALFRKMHSCDIELNDGMITIEPTHHDKLEGWSGDGFTEQDYVKVPADSPPEEIGAALRLAFSRCTG